MELLDAIFLGSAWLGTLMFGWPIWIPGTITALFIVLGVQVRQTQ